MSGPAVTATGADGERGGREGAYEDTTPRSYGVDTGAGRHPGLWRTPPVSDLAVVLLAGTIVIAVWSGSPAVAITPAVALGATFRSGRLLFLAVILATLGAVRSQHAWEGLSPDRLGRYAGWARLVDDPQPYPSSTRVIVAIDGERFEMWSRGRAQQQRVRAWRGGDRVAVSGRRTALEPARAHRVAWQHVVGEFDLEWVGDVYVGGPVARASNRVRATIEDGAGVLPEPYGALFRGLVIGDDRDQPRDMIDRFRASGLSHLTAVSGQNVSFLLAACGPLLIRLRPTPRWLATVVLIAWFVTLTRFEPSIVRAGAMAALSATAYVTGRERAPLRILALAVLALVLVDPLLVWSVGFWLSVGATGGVSAIGPVLADRFHPLGPLAMPLAVTLGAQLGVVAPIVLVFGRLPLVSVPANLLAVPVAGAVMLYGIPAALLAGWAPLTAPVLMFPALLGTKWVDTVARLGARLEPGAPWNWIGWFVVVVAAASFAVLSPRRDKNRTRHDDPSPDR